MKKIITCILISISSISIAQYNMQWYKSYNNQINGSGNYDYAYDIVQDNSGNVYITGDSYGLGDYSQHDFATIKYNSVGDTEWVRRYNYIQIDYSSIVDLDYLNNVYVAGVSTDSGSSGYSVVIIKYASDGQQLWVKRYSDPVYRENEITSMKIDLNGNVYITGIANTYMVGGSTFILKFNPNGDIIWSDRMTSGKYLNYFMKINLDIKGNIYIAGRGKDKITGISGFLVIKYDSIGNRKWLRVKSLNDWDISSDIEIDKNGNVYTSGSGRVNSTYDFVLLKYDSLGNFLWNQIYHNFYPNSNQVTIQNMILVDSNDNICVNFNIYGDNSNITDIVIAKYNPSGNLVFDNVYDYNSGYENATDFAIDEKDNLYTVGRSGSNTGNNSFVILKHNSNGILLNEIRNNNQFNKFFRPNAISVTKNGDIAATGTTQQESAGYLTDFLTIKYSSVIGIQPNSENIPNNFNLNQNYPNPFNPKTIISYTIGAGQLAAGSFTSLKVYNALGREVATLVNQKQNAGTYEVDFDGSNLSSGVYFYKLESENYSDTKNMILLK
ncbi:MAG: T9SS type A sorting domain-containing protein [Ignavibacteria bacterium]